MLKLAHMPQLRYLLIDESAYADAKLADMHNTGRCGISPGEQPGTRNGAGRAGRVDHLADRTGASGLANPLPNKALWRWNRLTNRSFLKNCLNSCSTARMNMPGWRG